jgi:oligoribonuclease NrnB/cAMP/cGMP phosphodiesterase (DHH superfamily)
MIVDFSYKRDVLIKMSEQADSILILDHHKSAQADLVNLLNNVVAIFDMERSGAMLAWHHFNPDQPAPELINHIQDRDLWQFKLTGTREIQAALFSYPYHFETWDILMDCDINDLFGQGVILDRNQQKNTSELIAVTKRRMEIAGIDVPAASIPYIFSSDAGDHMAKGEFFAACYWDTETHRVFSLRSTEDGLDVSGIAEQFGGGGHKHAAGFSVPRSHVLAQS